MQPRFGNAQQTWELRATLFAERLFDVRQDRGIPVTSFAQIPRSGPFRGPKKCRQGRAMLTAWSYHGWKLKMRQGLMLPQVKVLVLLPSSAQAVWTSYHRPSGLENKLFSSQFWKPGSSRLRHQQGGFLVLNPLLLACGMIYHLRGWLQGLLFVSAESGCLVSLLLRALIPWCIAHPQDFT